MSVSVRVIGDAAIARAMADAGEKIQRNTLKRSVRRAANIFKDEAKRLAPHVPGGADMRDAIGVSVRSPGGLPTAVVRLRGPHAFLGLFHEFGVAPHWIGEEGQELTIGENVVEGPVLHPGHRAQPFFRPAFDTQQDAAFKAFEDYLRGEVEKQGYMVAEPQGDDE